MIVRRNHPARASSILLEVVAAPAVVGALAAEGRDCFEGEAALGWGGAEGGEGWFFFFVGFRVLVVGLVFG